jgi:hypothetical protein
MRKYLESHGEAVIEVNLARRHMTFSRERPRRGGADLLPVAEVVSDRVFRAMVDSSRALS